MDASEDPRAPHRPALYELVWHKLVEHGATRATVTFSGSGDSGQIDDVYFETSDNNPHIEHDHPIYTELLDVAAFGEDGWVESMTLPRLVERLADNHIGNYEDWWDGEGGNGTFVWIVSDGTHLISMAQLEAFVRCPVSDSRRHHVHTDRQ